MSTASKAAPSERQLTARHEAAHAVVAALVAERGDTFPIHADVIPNLEEKRAGAVVSRRTQTNRDVLISLAGLVQDTMDGSQTREQALHGAGRDIESIGDPALAAHFWTTVESMLTCHRAGVTELANYLDTHGEADEMALRQSIGGLVGRTYRDLPIQAHFSHGKVRPNTRQHGPSTSTPTIAPTTRHRRHPVARLIRSIWSSLFHPHGDEFDETILPPPRWTAVILGAVLFATSGWAVGPAIEWWIDHSGIDYVVTR